MHILDEQRFVHPLELLEPVVSIAEFQEIEHAVRSVYVDKLLQRWIIELVRATRRAEPVAIGSSVRGSLALERAARAWALLSGRSYVIPGDVERLFEPVLQHRVVFKPSFLARSREGGWDEAIDALKTVCFEAAPAPGSDLSPLWPGQRQGVWRARS